jgi:hypothetical protein
MAALATRASGNSGRSSSGEEDLEAALLERSAATTGKDHGTLHPPTDRSPEGDEGPRISYVGATPAAQVYLCAALLINVGAAAGYVVANTARSLLARHLLFTDGLYILLAAAFAVDALLYLASWHGAQPPPSRAALAAEALNIVPSLGYVITAALYPWDPGDPQLTGGVLVAEVAFSLVFLVDACLYFGVWWFDIRDACDRAAAHASSTQAKIEPAIPPPPQVEAE